MTHVRQGFTKDCLPPSSILTLFCKYHQPRNVKRKGRETSTYLRVFSHVVPFHPLSEGGKRHIYSVFVCECMSISLLPWSGGQRLNSEHQGRPRVLLPAHLITPRFPALAQSQPGHCLIFSSPFNVIYIFLSCLITFILIPGSFRIFHCTDMP